MMCTLTVDDHTSASGVKRYMLGREPIQTRDGKPLTDSKGRRSYVTSAGAGPSVGKHLLMAYLPPEHAVVGEQLAVEYLNERYPVTVAIVGLDADLRSRERADPLVNILVCAKRVPMTGGTIVLTADEQAIETRHLGFTISPHEECGVEEAVRLIEAQGGESVVLTLGPAEAEEQLRDAMALGIDRAILLQADEEYDGQATAGRDRRVDPGRAGGRRRVRPDLLRQRVGRLGRLPGRHPRRARAGLALRHRRQGCRGRPTAALVCEQETASRARRLRRAAAGGRDRQGGAQPAPLPVGAGSAASQAQAARDADARSRREAGVEKLRLKLPPGQGKQAEILGHGPDAAPAVVEVLRQAGLVS